MSGTMIGSVLNNRYQITDRIGIGGMAEVYRAQDNVLGRLVAVKVMLPQYAADPSFTQRFKQEAAAAANLQSPYIVNVYDWGHDSDTYYIVMEYVRGSDLKTAINERGAINQRKVAEIGSQVCQALSVAHKLDIIHRDIKPQNIMVQPDGNVKVMDFGIARAKNSVKTQTSSVLGTAHYISPEQAQGKELTPASDIYSLGIVLYEAATGRLPFDGPDAVSVAMKQVSEMPAYPSEVNPAIDPDLEAIIMKAMAKNPADRFATAADMKLALNDFLAGRPVQLGGFANAQTAVIGGAVAGGAAGGMAGGARVPVDGTAVMPQMAGGGRAGGMGGVNPVNTQAAYRASGGYGDDQGGGSKKTIGIIVGVAVVLVLAAVAVFAFASGMFSGGDGPAIPDVKGQTVEQATATLEDAGFAVNPEVNEVSDNTVDEGKVVSTDPKAGTRHPEGTEVTLNVSSGEGQVAVPSIVGKSTEEAKKLIEDAGLVPVADAGEFDPDAKEGEILSQSPDGGEMVDRGTEVHYVASLGAEKQAVPNVRNKTQEDAYNELREHGFEVVVETEYSDDVREGYVSRQNPEAGIELDPAETTVTIWISQGPEPVEEAQVPYVSNGAYTLAYATEVLEQAGFQVSVSGSNDPNAIVINQSHTGSAEVGTVITLTTEDPQPTEGTVPSVIGWPVSQAIAELNAAGFEVTVSGSDDPAAIVVDQSITGTAPFGTTIMLGAELPE